MSTRSGRAGEAALALLLAVQLAACNGVEGPDPQPVSITLTATPVSAPAGTSITFHVEAKGNSLAGLAVAYGDGAVDSLATFLARSAGATRTHAYVDAGTYLARATVLDSDGTSAADSVSVSVTPTSRPAR